jgi:protein-disulfide isomerase
MNFPLDFHAQAKPAAEAAYCAREQSDEAFWKYHDIIFANQGALDTASLSKYAKDLSLDVAKFDACVALTKYDSVIDAEIALGKSVGVSGTPSFYINGVQYVGALPYEAFAAAIDAELAN